MMKLPVPNFLLCLSILTYIRVFLGHQLPPAEYGQQKASRLQNAGWPGLNFHDWAAVLQMKVVQAP